MSISPIDDDHRIASLSCAFLKNPSSSDGSPLHPPQIEVFSVNLIAGCGSEVQSSESLVAVFGDSCDPSNKVTGFRELDTMNVSYGQNNGTILECQPTGREQTTQLSSDQFGPTQINGKCASSDHLGAGIIGLLANTAQLAARRNQVVNANHLLNFYYDPISHPQSPLPPPPPRRQQMTKPYNKDLFIQVNYNFAVSDIGCCEVESEDPDKLLPWEPKKLHPSLHD